MSIEDVLNNKTAWHIECGNATEVMRAMPANSVHLCVTSPPYFGLRAYSKDASTDELGREKAPDCLGWASGHKCGCCYTCRIVAVCEEVKRVLRDDGVFFLNLADSFWGSWGNAGSRPELDGKTLNQRPKGAEYIARGGWDNNRERPPQSYRHDVLKPKDLVGIPWRVALALQASGWLLRMDMLWTKLSPMPSSTFGWQWERCRVKVGKGRKSQTKKGFSTNGAPHGASSNGKFDSSAGWLDCPGCSKCEPNGGFILRRGSWRPTTAHEYIFMFAKSQKYFADGYAVRQRLAEATIMRDRYTRVLDDPDEQFAVAHDHESVSNPDDGANLRSWLVLPGENFSGKHYAVFPPSLPALAIKCGTSEAGVCPHCGAPHARMVQKKTCGKREYAADDKRRTGLADASADAARLRFRMDEESPPSATILGWRQTCKCPAHEPIGAVVLDPFMGAGTTAVAARRLGRRVLGLELYEENTRLASERIRNDSPLFNGP